MQIFLIEININLRNQEKTRIQETFRRQIIFGYHIQPQNLKFSIRKIVITIYPKLRENLVVTSGKMYAKCVNIDLL